LTTFLVTLCNQYDIDPPKNGNQTAKNKLFSAAEKLDEAI